MELHLLPIVTSFLLVVAVVNHAHSLPSKVDSKSALPKTPFRKAMRSLLMHPVYINAHKDTSSIVGYDAVYGYPQPGGRSISARKDASSVAGYDAVYGNPQQKAGGSSINAHKDTSSIVGYDAVYGTSQKQEGSSINAHKDSSSIAGYDAVYGYPQPGERSISARKDASSVAGYDAVYGNPQQKAGGSSISARKDASSIAEYEAVYGISQNKQGSSNNAHRDASSAAGYDAANVFLEKDLHPGTKMAVRFTKTSRASHFLPHQAAESIPFSSNKLPEILNLFSVKENSAQAKAIQKTIEQCETPAIVGEDKYCARSLESLIDFSTSRLGKNIRALSNEVEVNIQEYKFGEGVKMVGEKSVVCHQLNYPYAVAFCHTLHMTKIYMIPLVGADGSKIEAVAVCHEDTSAWDPKAGVFQTLKVKAGTLPICHFLPNGHIVWVPK